MIRSLSLSLCRWRCRETVSDSRRLHDWKARPFSIRSWWLFHSTNKRRSAAQHENTKLWVHVRAHRKRVHQVGARYTIYVRNIRRWVDRRDKLRAVEPVMRARCTARSQTHARIRVKNSPSPNCTYIYIYARLYFCLTTRFDSSARYFRKKKSTKIYNLRLAIDENKFFRSLRRT